MNTVAQLKAIEKERSIRGYYKIRKAELIRVLEATRLVEQKSIISDEPISNHPTPVLQPTPWRQSIIALKNMQNIKISLPKACKRQQNSLLRVYKRLKILVNGC